jgi:seryl-tRNA synthetase
MLDIQFIRENPDLIRLAATKKLSAFKVEDLLAVDERRLAILGEVEAMRAKQNKVTGKVDEAQLAALRELKEQLQNKEKELAEVMKEWQKLMLEVPNVPDISVPDGKSDLDNKEFKLWGKPAPLPFPPQSHIALMEKLDLADFERGTKLAGFRGYVLKNEAVSLNVALWQYTLNYFIKHGFQPIFVPSMVKPETLMGTGYLPQGKEDLYVTQDNMYLAGTAEVGVMSYFQDEFIEVAKEPKKFIAFSPCFRREAGSHGRDAKGLFRVHEFFKWEQVVLCPADHQESVKYHEEVTAHAEALLQALKLPYRVVINCGADLGQGQVKKHDIEVWFPSEGKYRETHSASYFHDFQTRRLNIRYRDEAGKARFAHSINNTAIATPRLLAAIIDNYQDEDGNVRIPEILVPLVGKELITNANRTSTDNQSA